MVDERDKARARLGLPPLATTSAAAPAFIVDEQARIQGARSATPTPDPSSLSKMAGETNTQFNNRVKAAEAEARTKLAAENPLFNKAVKPTDAPAGQYYAWIGGTNTGSWQLYNIPGSATAGGGGGGGGGGGNQTPASASTASTNTQANLKTPEQLAAEAAKAQAQGERQSAYDLLYSQFKLYGLESLVEPLKGLITSGASPAEFTIKLRDSDAYKLRFAANAKRIANGFKAIDEATYLNLEDRYQSLMMNYGVPESYYKKGATGVQEGFEKLIANNVDPVTLEERIMEGVKFNQGSKLLIDTAKQFYPSLTDGDFLAYAIDPKNALSEIRRKVTAAEIGSAQIGAGLAATVGGAEELARAGITGKQYQQAAPTIAEASIRGGQLADIYKQSPYTQQTAEQALLDLPGSAEALRKTKKLTSLETAAFGGSAGAGAIARDRAGVL
jgi:hypothetical protein